MTTTSKRSTVRAGIITVALVLLGGCVAEGTTSEDEAQSDEAAQLADELNTALESAGLVPVATSTAEQLYGSDGGWTCEVVGGLDHKLAVNQFGNLSANHRRIFLDPSIVAYDEAVIQTYCPDELDDYQDVIDGIEQKETIADPS